jgi:hypothetical protein
MWTQILIFLLLVIWIIAGVFITITSLDLGPYKDKDKYLSQAYTYSTWASVVTWITLALLIGLVVLAIFGVVALFSTGVGEVALATGGVASGISGITIFFLIIFIALLIASAVLSILTMNQIALSSLYTKDAKVTKAYKYAQTCAILTIITLIVVIGGFLIYFLFRNRKQPLPEEQVVYYQEEEVV